MLGTLVVVVTVLNCLYMLSDCLSLLLSLSVLLSPSFRLYGLCSWIKTPFVRSFVRSYRPTCVFCFRPMCLLCVCVCVLLCFCTVHSIVCLMFMMRLPYGVINYIIGVRQAAGEREPDRRLQLAPEHTAGGRLRQSIGFIGRFSRLIPSVNCAVTSDLVQNGVL